MDDVSNKKKYSVVKKDIRLDIIAKVVRRNWRRYLMPVSVTVVVASLLALSVPRYYTVKIMLAPEYASSPSMPSGLGSIASAVGLRLGNMTTQDAITPLFYPDLMQSTNFLIPLLDVKVVTKDSAFCGSYKDYLMTQQQIPWWGYAVQGIKSLFASKSSDSKGKKIDPFYLSRRESELVKAVSSGIMCSVDKKTDIITISTTAQDPLVAALFADTVKEHLQDFIISYRTKKARTDLEHIDSLCSLAKAKYEKSLINAATYMDANQELFLQRYQVEQDKLKSESQINSSAYNLLMQQRQLAEAKVLERTPVFTTIQNSTVPVKHSGPKRMLFVLAMTIIVFLIRTVQFVVKDVNTNL